LIDAPESRRAFSKAGLELVEREFSWKTIISNWLEQLEGSPPGMGIVHTADDHGKMVQASDSRTA
jgi:hypothetical protein